jgi:hypothetical protein
MDMYIHSIANLCYGVMIWIQNTRYGVSQMTLTNTQKKILAVILTITSPVWILVVLPLYVIIAFFSLIYAGIADALDVK